MRAAKIHIGAHKTGSTAIQRALQNSKAALSAKGISYPDIGFVYYGHHGIAEALWQGGVAYDQIAKDLAQISADIVLSSENFSLLSLTQVRGLANILKNDDVQIVFYQRSFIEMPYVWWQETVKHGSNISFLRYYSDCLLRPYRQHIFNSTTMLKVWADVFGESALAVFEYRKGIDVAQEFVESVLHIKDTSISAGNDVNKSYKPFLTDCMWYLNSHGIKGIEAVKDPVVRSFLNTVEPRASNYISRIDLDYNSFVFNALERGFFRTWSCAIRNQTLDNQLFANRSYQIEYVEPIFWIDNAEAAVQLLALCKQHNRASSEESA